MILGCAIMCRLVTDYLDSTVLKYPDKIAYIDSRRKINFKDLKAESYSIAYALATGGCYKKPVLLFMEKSISLICSFIGVAYSGNFYSPIDTKMPKERIKKIIEILDPSVVITDENHFEQVKTIIENRTLWVYEEIVSNNIIDSTVDDVKVRIIDTDALYVLFTSGSTGTPKGVIINHRAVVDFIDWISGCYCFDKSTVFANQAQLYFDLSIQDVYAPLKNGSTTILIPNRMYSAPVRVWNYILKYKVNTLVWIPSMLSLYANLDILGHMEKADLKTVLFCGEVMPMKQLNYWIKHYPDVIYGNLYGPTECTEACTYYTINRPFSDDDVLPIGKPCENSDAMIIDDSGSVVKEIGKIGELCIRGTCLSDGYYRDFEKTKESFVQNPLNSHFPEVIYRTGDLACYNEFNELVYVSRKDFQIKIRGYRVELGEIEAAASSVDQIMYNCCLFDKKNEKIIMVYTGEIDESTLNDALKLKLQDYMLPTTYIHRDNMIFNINGKIDRTSLMNEYIHE